MDNSELQEDNDKPYSARVFRSVPGAVPVVIGSESPTPDDVDDALPVFGATEAELLSGLGRVLAQDEFSGRDLLLVRGGYRYEAGDVEALIEVLRADPMVGFVVPRTDLGGEAPVPALRDIAGDRKAAWSEAAGSLPSAIFGWRLRGAPVLVSEKMLRFFGGMPTGMATIDDAIACLFNTANRRGYSCAVCNQSLFLADGHPRDSTSAVSALSIDSLRIASCFSANPDEIAVAQHLFLLRSGGRRRLLFDIRNLEPTFNGTAEHIVALAAQLAPVLAERDFDATFLVGEEAASFHGLHDLGLKLSGSLPDGYFDVGIRLSQPWSFSEFRELAACASLNVYLMLDTIAWDCHYIRPPNLDGLWRTVASFADGLLFNSGFTRDRFVARFPSAAAARLGITLCSLDPSDYRDPIVSALPARPESFVLVVGNRYFHKDLGATVDKLSRAFPGQHFVVLGGLKKKYPNVELLQSGSVGAADVERTFKDAACLVFPSHYEGFGLPVMHAVAYDSPVILRENPLVEELRREGLVSCDLRTYATDTQLLRAVKAVLESPRRTSGRREIDNGAFKHNWHAAAGNVLDLVDRLLSEKPWVRRLARQEFLYRLAQKEAESQHAPQVAPDDLADPCG